MQNNTNKNMFSNYLLDTLQHYDIIKYFGNEEYEKQKIFEHLIIREKSNIKMYKQDSMFTALQIIAVGVGLTIITLKSGHAVLSREITIGGFILLNSYILQFSLPLSYIGYVVQTLKRGIVDIKEFISLTENIPQSLPLFCEVELSNPNIEFRDVSFSYDGINQVIKDVSFKVNYGETFAILGKTGSGKSTIVKLLLRFIEPTKGKILVNNINILTIPQKKLIQIFGIVPQDCALFNRTIFENIIYGDLNAKSESASYIMKLLGLDHIKDSTIMGERSIKVSGGEKQRIAIARIFLKNPTICIFDEFTSSLDIHTESQILDLINTLFKNNTKIIITHKFTTITNADKIMLMNNGRVVAIDSHKNLLVKSHEYAEQWGKALVASN